MKPKLTAIQRDFWSFIEKREEARWNKENPGQGFARVRGTTSNDPIIAQYHFCNVDREKDRVTKWIHENVRIRYRDGGLPFMITQLTAARIFNEPRVLQHILPFEDQKSFTKACAVALKKEGKLLRGAYLTIAISGGPLVPYWARVLAQVQSKVSRRGWRPTSLREIADVLMSVKGIGEFLANQIVTDLRYIAMNFIWKDWTTFVMAGPGTLRGLRKYFDMDRLSQKEAQQLLLMIRKDHAPHYRPVNLRPSIFDDINNLSNCFCEFDKYIRVKSGEADRLKRNYRPASDLV